MEQLFTLSPRFARLQARLLDMMFCWWPLFFGSLGAICLFEGLARSDTGMYVLALGFLLTLVLSLYNLALFLRTGQTWGKRHLGLLVVSTSGYRASKGTLLWRWASPMVLAMVPIVQILTYFDCLFIFGESRRCLHDHLASTMVVDLSSFCEPGPSGTGINPSSEDIGFTRFS